MDDFELIVKHIIAQAANGWATGSGETGAGTAYGPRRG